MSNILNEIISKISENINEIVLWGFTIVALFGSYFNSTMRVKLSYVIWFLSNFFFVWHNFRIGEMQQGLLFFVYLFTSVVGLKNSLHHKGWFTRVSM